MKNYKVMLLEDNVADAEIFMRHFNINKVDVKFSVVHFQKLSEALHALKHEIFDILITDLNLKKIKGFDTFSNLMKFSSDMPIIILSNIEDVDLIKSCIDHGAQDYIFKNVISPMLLLRCCEWSVERFWKQQDIKRLNDELKIKSKFKSEFIANMSHEIRTPLNSILGMLSLLETTELSTEQLELCHVSIQSSEVLLSLINDILDVSKIESGKLELDTKPIDLSIIMDEVFNMFSENIATKCISLVGYISSNVPKVLGDKARIKQILINLIGNAIKFTDN